MDNNAGRIGEAVSKIIHEPAANLAERVIFSVRMVERRRAVREEIIFSSASLLSLGAFVEAVRYTLQVFYQSGASQIFSLLFSDFQSMVSNWQYFSLSLAESLPATSLALTFASVAALFIFISLSIRNLKNISRMNDFNIQHA